MKKFVAGALFAVAASNADAIVINTTGTHVINSLVDEVVVDSSLNTEDVMIMVVSGGVVQNNIECSGSVESCDFRVTVSGNGNVMGRVRGAGAQIHLLGDAQVGVAGVQANDGGRIVIDDNVHLGLLTGAGSGVIGRFEVNGGFIDEVIASPQLLLMNMNGGVIDDSLYGWGLSLDMRGGAIIGNVQSDFELVMDMRGGHIAGDVRGIEGLEGSIVGGSIDGNLLARVGGTFDISGGLFGGGTGSSLWTLGGAQIFNVHGRDLVLTGTDLTGFLLDGSVLNVDVSFLPSFTGALNLYNVPEPGTLALIGVGLFGAFAARRKAKAAH